MLFLCVDLDFDWQKSKEGDLPPGYLRIPAFNAWDSPDFSTLIDSLIQSFQPGSLPVIALCLFLKGSRSKEPQFAI